MSAIFGHLNVSDADRVFNATAGQRAIYDAAQDYINKVNADIAKAMSVFVEKTTSDFKWRYKLPGGGYLQRRGSDGRYGATKAYGSWDVAFPLEDFGAALAGNDVDMAYMTIAELDRHIQTIVAQNVNTVRYEMLAALRSNLSTALAALQLAQQDTLVGGRVDHANPNQGLLGITAERDGHEAPAARTAGASD
jgi:hypothetical protein